MIPSLLLLYAPCNYLPPFYVCVVACHVCAICHLRQQSQTEQWRSCEEFSFFLVTTVMTCFFPSQPSNQSASMNSALVVLNGGLKGPVARVVRMDSYQPGGRSFGLSSTHMAHEW